MEVGITYSWLIRVVEKTKYDDEYIFDLKLLFTHDSARSSPAAAAGPSSGPS